ncbi:serine/threonine protein phosphatase 1 [Sphingomonas jinjuensis]|uniref:Serine/threonine protein phosphatase 1 n=1 Tax=Sphingomonas jinjuensis TaxID=535907 RepID=A0A840FKZ1_9SPHN|nr:metallophosphoesterase family protein [Sphingomonas jinjuensis]MBB4153985.1 serine/threonine protein phosphatase 1 [Sphingomonas jinjuensis]
MAKSAHFAPVGLASQGTTGLRLSSRQRIYAIGDIHGRLDLLETLMASIRSDHAGRGVVPAIVILLGDLIDRGPQSAALVEWAMRAAQASDQFIVLKGNHEAMMIDALAGDIATLEFWLDQGGRETLQSWGVEETLLAQGASPGLARTARNVVGKDVLGWFASLPTMVRSDGHLFVHAGIRPGVPIEQQQEEDVLWIRRAFLDSQADHGFVVVHGHTVHEAGPDIRPNRIGLDTGAFMTGRLTAIGIEGAETWFLATEPSEAEDRNQPVDVSDVDG